MFLGREIASHKDYSEQTAVLIDQEVRSIVEGAYNRALELLRDNLDKLHLLANTLLEREVLDGDEMDRVLRGEKLPSRCASGRAPPAPPRAARRRRRSRRSETRARAATPFPPPAPRPAGA